VKRHLMPSLLSPLLFLYRIELSLQLVGWKVFRQDGIRSRVSEFQLRELAAGSEGGLDPLAFSQISLTVHRLTQKL